MESLFLQYEAIAKSGLFDAEYYLRAYPEISGLNVDPLMHYLERGCREGRNPSAQFDAQHYLVQCGALGEAPDNPLLHFLTVGAKRGLTPHPRAVAAAPASVKHSRKAAPATRPEAQPANSAPHPEPTAQLAPFPGHVDFYGYSNAAGGWLFCGWAARPPRTDQAEPVEFRSQFERSHVTSKATLAFYQRDDLDSKAVGVIAFAPGTSRAVGNLQGVSYALDGITYQAQTGHGTTTRLANEELVERTRANLLHRAFANRSRDQLLSITARRGFTGEDTLSRLNETVLLEADEVIFCPPDGVLIKGWQLSPPGLVRAFRVRCGHLSGELVLAEAIAVSRSDVIEAAGQQHGFSDPMCGFVAFVPGAISPGDAAYVEVELENGEVAFKNLKLSRRTGIDAIRKVLEGVHVRYGQLDAAFDKVLGPAVRAINEARLRQAPTTDELSFGQAPSSPRCSLVVPLYGRMDFIEYQMAAFTRHRASRDLEIIYVLDEPLRRNELLALAQSVFERFQIPFRLVLLHQNVGFAPASNVGLRLARAPFVCFLNSDVFPITLDWAERLVQRLENHPEIGAIGPRLLFEDGSVQHEGCVYAKLPEFGNWTFVDHRNKGRRPGPRQGLRRWDMITAACMVLPRALALELGGLDEAYVVGDFEDSDLCLRIRQRGLSCAVDDEVELYHLERKSQDDPAQNWRLNLTLYNAWVHQRRWFTNSPDKAGAASPAN